MAGSLPAIHVTGSRPGDDQRLRGEATGGVGGAPLDERPEPGEHLNASATTSLDERLAPLTGDGHSAVSRISKIVVSPSFLTRDRSTSAITLETR